MPLAARSCTISPASAVPNWKVGDTISLGRTTLRVVGIRDDDADYPPVLIVGEASSSPESHIVAWVVR
jgi:hypothetical protein